VRNYNSAVGTLDAILQEQRDFDTPILEKTAQGMPQHSEIARGQLFEQLRGKQAVIVSAKLKCCIPLNLLQWVCDCDIM
jgi:hypothetical protein